MRKYCAYKKRSTCDFQAFEIRPGWGRREIEQEVSRRADIGECRLNWIRVPARNIPDAIEKAREAEKNGAFKFHNPTFMKRAFYRVAEAFRYIDQVEPENNESLSAAFERVARRQPQDMVNRLKGLVETGKNDPAARTRKILKKLREFLPF